MNYNAVLPIAGTLSLCALAALLGVSAARSYPGVVADAPRSEQQLALQDRNAGSGTMVLPAPRADIYYQAVLDRPLFAPSRRPQTDQPIPEQVAQIVPETPPSDDELPPPDLTLAGILGGPDNRSALVGDAKTEVEWVREGHEIAGWTVTKIEPEWIELSAGRQNLRVELFK